MAIRNYRSLHHGVPFVCISIECGESDTNDVFSCPVLSKGKRKNCKFPWGIEPQTFKFHAPMLHHWATQNLRRRGTPSLESNVTCIPRAARIGNVESLVWFHQIIEMVNFKLGSKIKMDVCSSCFHHFCLSYSLHLSAHKFRKGEFIFEVKS